MRRLILVSAVLPLVFFVGISVEGQISETASDSKLLSFIYGDCNYDGKIDLGDVVYLISYLFRSGPEPIPYLAGDCNCDQIITIGDVVHLINYLFRNGPTPGCPLGWIDGIVYNCNTNEPLEGAIIKITALSDSIFSDTAGQFFFEVPSGQEFVLTITKPGFTYAQRKATAPEERDMAVDPVYLKPLDTLVTHITPAGGTAVDSRGHIELIFPPGAVPYDIDVIATQYDKGKELPTPLPDLSVFTYAVELEPHGVVFNDSVTLRVANTLGFDPGTPIPNGFYNDSTAQWEDVGMAYVGPDGEWLECKIIRFSGYDLNGAIWWLLPDTTPQIKYNVTSDQNKEIDLECSSPIGRKTGTLWINHALPQFRTMGVSQASRFVYNSSTTHPNPILETYTTIDSATMNWPSTVRWILKIEGQWSSTHFVGGYGNSQQAILFSAKNFRGDTLETGSYDYTLKIENCYSGRRYATTPCFGCIPVAPTNVTIGFPVCKWTTVTGDKVVINNRLKSPFGVGWGLAELQMLHFNPASLPAQTGPRPSFLNTGSITLEEGDGTLLTYTPDSLGYYSPPEGEYSQLRENEDGSFTRKFRDGTTINFDESGLMTSVVDRNQNTTSYNYNEDDLLVSIVSPVGQITQFVYDDSNYLDKVIDPAGRVTDFTIDSEGDVVEIMDPDSSITHYGYSDHSLTQLINPKGDTTKYSYDEFYRLTEVEEPGGACCKSGYYHITPTDVQGLINSIPDTLGGEENPAPRVNPDTIWSTSIDGKGNITKIKTDKFGGILQRLDPLGRLNVFERDSNSNITEITKPNGAVTNMTYDSLGNLLTYVAPTRAETTWYTYEPNFNQVTSITDPKGNITYIEYDSLGNAIRIIDALNDTTQMEYNIRGQLTKIINALSHSDVFRYDTLGNLEVATNPLGDSVILAYNLAGDVISSADPLGRVTQYGYDIMGRLVKEVDADSNIIQYEYDVKGNLTKVIDAELHETQFFYDSRDQLVKTINPLGDSIMDEYDINGNLILSINPNGDSIHYEYDLLDRLIQKVLPYDSVLYVYDLVGNIVKIEDEDSRVGFNYELSDRLKNAVSMRMDQEVVGKGAQKVRYSYDLNGNVDTCSAFYPNSGNLDARIDFYAGDGPVCVSSGDLDGDGNPDLVVANDSSGEVSILFGMGDGTFQYPVFYSVGGNPSFVVIEKLDSDDYHDLAVANRSTDSVSILINNGDGTFQEPISYPVGEDPVCIASRDFDGDGDHDLAVADSASLTVTILANDGLAHFETVWECSAMSPTKFVYSEDFDNDSTYDLAVGIGYQHYGYIAVFLNNGNATFDTAVNYAATGYPNSIYSEDFNQDGLKDLAVANGHDPEKGLFIFFNTGNGNFDDLVLYPSNRGGRSVTAKDIDNDDDFDLILSAFSDTGTVDVFFNNGSGSFDSSMDYGAGNRPASVSAEDFDKNGWVDFATANLDADNVSIFKNTGNGIFPKGGDTYKVYWAGQFVTTGDFDVDGDTDLFFTGHFHDIYKFSVLQNNGHGVFPTIRTFDVDFNLYAPFPADFDHDGDDDIAVGGLDSLYILSNDGNADFSKTAAYETGRVTEVVFAEDLNGDGWLDLVAANYHPPGNVCVLMNRGDGTFVPSVKYPIGSYAHGLWVEDLDGDDDKDVAVATAAMLTVYLNNGSGQLTDRTDYDAGTYSTDVCAADFDGDHDNDLAVSDLYDDSVYVFINDSSANFDSMRAYPKKSGSSGSWSSWDVRPSDWDLDGDGDLLLGNRNNFCISILINDGNAGFDQILNYGATAPWAVREGDFDADGDMDVAILNATASGGSATLLLNLDIPLETTIYSYDSLNRLTSIVADSTDTTAFTYDKLSRRTSKQYANGAVAEYGYDQASQLLSMVNRLNNDTISFYNYDYDPVGNRIKMMEKAGVDSFTYDVLYRLTGAIHPQPSNPEESFDYDGVGNRTFSHISTNYTYDAANRLLEDDQYQYRYDKNGNLVWKMAKAKTPRRMRRSPIGQRPDLMEKTAGDSVVYSWNAENTLLGFVEYHLGDTAKVVTYKYDGLGRRIEKKVDTLVTKYVYDNEDILFEFEGSDSLIATYTHGPGIDEPISVQRDGGKYYYHQDGLGSITYITDTLGNVINTYLYDSFGNIMERTGGLENSYTYTGREWDEESGLYYYRARYYDPRMGRFLGIDPIRPPKRQNSFRYVSNNPLNLKDPFGLIDRPPEGPEQCELPDYIDGGLTRVLNQPIDHLGNTVQDFLEWLDETLEPVADLLEKGYSLWPGPGGSIASAAITIEKARLGKASGSEVMKAGRGIVSDIASPAIPYPYSLIYTVASYAETVIEWFVPEGAYPPPRVP